MLCGFNASIDAGVSAEKDSCAGVTKLMGEFSWSKGGIGTGEDPSRTEGAHEDDRDEKIIATEKQKSVSGFEEAGVCQTTSKA